MARLVQCGRCGTWTRGNTDSAGCPCAWVSPDKILLAPSPAQGRHLFTLPTCASTWGMILGWTVPLGLCRRVEFSEPTMGLEIWQHMSVLAVRSMPTVGVAHWNEIPKPSAEGWWGQELCWSQFLVEGLICSPVTTVGSMDSRAVVQPCAPLHCLAAAPWDTSCSAGWGGFTLCFI